MRTLWGILYWVLAIITLVFFKEAFVSIISPAAFIAFGLGIFMYSAYQFLMRRKLRNRTPWFRSLTHEYTHSIFSILFLNRMVSLQVSQSGAGSVQYYGKSNHLITLSPYCVPIYSVLLILLATFIQPDMLAYLNGLLGLTYAFHLHTFFKQARPYQDDLKQVGIFSSYGFIILFNTIFASVIVLHMNHPGISSFAQFCKISYETLLF